MIPTGAAARRTCGSTALDAVRAGRRQRITTTSTPPTTRPEAQIITPRTRTFIPARVTDNPHLFGTGYMTTAAGTARAAALADAQRRLPRRHGRRPVAGHPDAWVEAAMARWTRPLVLPVMDSMGVDVARGGKDNTTIARRHGNWFDETLVYPGTQTPDGPTVAGLSIAALRDLAPIHIDVIGVGASPYDFLKSAKPAGDRRQCRRARARHRQVGAADLLEPALRAVVEVPRMARPVEQHGRAAACPTSSCWPSCARRSGSPEARSSISRAASRSSSASAARPTAPRPSSSR
jgi:hypothetical protein